MRAACFFLLSLFHSAFSTPTIVKRDGKPLLISSGAKAHYGYEPATGKELWRFEERSAHSAAVRPLVANGTMFMPAGYLHGQVLAIKLGGAGLLDETHLAWRLKKAAPNKPSLLAEATSFYMINDGGIVTAPVKVPDVHATILHQLGLDHERLTYRHAGRDYRLTDVKGNVLKQILA